MDRKRTFCLTWRWRSKGGGGVPSRKENEELLNLGNLEGERRGILYQISNASGNIPYGVIWGHGAETKHSWHYSNPVRSL